MGLLGLGIGGGGSGGSTSFSSLTNIIVPKTVAQMQTLAGASGFTAGQIYQITNAYSSTAVINIKAFSTSVLEDYGFGTFQNANMADDVDCFIWYELSSDVIYRIYEPDRNNDIRRYQAGGGTAIDTFPFDNANWKSNTIIDCIFTVSSDSLLQNSFIGAETNVNIQNANLIQLNRCFIGNGKTMDFSAIIVDYIVSGKIYDGDESTFEVTANQVAAINPSASNRLDMANCQWAGILIPDNGANNLKQILNYPTDHKWSIAPVSGVTINVDDINVSGGGSNIQLEVTATSLAVNGTNSDFLEFQVPLNNAAIVQKIGGAIRS